MSLCLVQWRGLIGVRLIRTIGSKWNSSVLQKKKKSLLLQANQECDAFSFSLYLSLQKSDFLSINFSLLRARKRQGAAPNGERRQLSSHFCLRPMERSYVYTLHTFRGSRSNAKIGATNGVGDGVSDAGDQKRTNF